MEVPINYWAVLVSAVAALIIGGLWYGPVFGKLWMRLAGITPEAMKSMKLTPVQAMFGGFLALLLMAYVLAHVYVFASLFFGQFGATSGMMAAFWSWLGFVVPVTAGVFLWEGKSVKLWVLNATYYLVSMLAMGAIIGAWQ